MKYMWLLLWVFTIFAGAWFHPLAPSSWWYIIGFIAGAFGQEFFRLFNDERD